MKKLLLTMLIGLFLSPLQMFADHYECKQLKPLHKPVAKSPSGYLYSIALDYNTGDLDISFNNAISGLNITIERNGVTYLNTTVSLNSGQSYTDSLADYDEGTYVLTLFSSNGIIGQYEITVIGD